MITQDQLKDILERTVSLHRYLDIDKKKIEFEEEDLRTQAPDFWDDMEKAQGVLQKTKQLKNKIEKGDEDKYMKKDDYNDEALGR